MCTWESPETNSVRVKETFLKVSKINRDYWNFWKPEISVFLLHFRKLTFVFAIIIVQIPNRRSFGFDSLKLHLSGEVFRKQYQNQNFDNYCHSEFSKVDPSPLISPSVCFAIQTEKLRGFSVELSSKTLFLLRQNHVNQTLPAQLDSEIRTGAFFH